MSSPAFDISARLSDVVETTLKEGPQIVTKDGKEAAVLVSIEEWNRLKAQNQRSIKRVLLDPNGPHDLYIPPRRRFRVRPADLND